MKKIGLILSAALLLALSFGAAISIGESCYQTCERIYKGNPAAIAACKARCPR